MILLFCVMASCQTGKIKPTYSPATIENYSFSSPLLLEDGWYTKDSELSSESLAILKEGARDVLRGNYPNVHSILVAYRGKLVFEEYYPGHTYEGEWADYDIGTPHGLGSISKSVTALIFGIAYDQGGIKDIDSSIFAWYPEYSRSDRTQKEDISIRHLLTMQSGLRWNEHDVSYNSARNDMNRLIRSKDPADFYLRKRLVDDPGTIFTYSCGSTNLLADIIYRSTGQHIDAFAREFLFEPLAIRSDRWFYSHHDLVIAGPSIDLLPRDLLKIGQLILQNGKWQGKQIISGEWLSQMVYPAVSIENWNADYGFQWWLPRVALPETEDPLGPYMAGGRGGQWLMVYPKQECILVMTGGNYNSEDESFKWHDDYFLPALKALDSH